MSETQQTLDANSAGSAEGQENAMVNAATASDTSSTDGTSQVDPIVLETLQGITGRKYSSLDDAKKHLENLNRMVGDNSLAEAREKAQLLDNVLSGYAREQGISLKEAKEHIKNLVTTPTPIQQSEVRATQETVPPEVHARLARLEQFEFLNENPEAKQYIDKVSEFAKATGKSLQDSFSFLYKDVIKSSSENAQAEAIREEKRSASVTATSSGAAAPQLDSVKQLQSAYVKSGGKDDRFLMDIIKEKWNKNAANKK